MSCLMGSGEFVRGAEEVEFKLNFEDGKTYVTETVTDVETVLPLAGQVIESRVKMSMVSSQKASQQGQNTQVVQKLDAMKLDGTAAGMQLAYDSENPEGLLAATLGSLTDAETTMIIGADGKVISVKSNEVPGMEVLGMGENEMKQAAREIADLMPNKALKVGESWQASSKLPLTGISNEPATITYDMTFDSVVEKEGRQLAKIVIVGKVDEDDGNLRVTSKEIGGEMLFDPEIGQPRESKLVLSIEVGLPAGEESVEGEAKRIPMKTVTEAFLKEIK